MTSWKNALDAWQLLQSLEIPSGQWQVRKIEEFGYGGGDPLYALDSKGLRHLLIPIGPTQRVKADRRSSGVHICRNTLVNDGGTAHFVDVVCLKPHLHELFAIIAAEMLAAIQDDAKPPDLRCGEVLARWRELLERAPSPAPSIEKLAGLYGELWYLRELCRIEATAIQHWTGPDAARHDFTGAGGSLEVKSSLARHGRFFTVHGHQQLEPPPGGDLYLAAMKLEHSASSGEAVADLVDEISALGADKAALLAGLAGIGVTADHLEATRINLFSIVENRVYLVGDDFPKIIANSFVNSGLPAGIVRIDYVIDLTGEPPTPLETSAISELYASVISRLS